jgi:hypothetical protein
MFETKLVGSESQPGSFSLVGVPIVVDEDDFKGVQIAAKTLAHDFARVTGGQDSPLVLHTTLSSLSSAKNAIIIGSLSKSSIVQSLVQQQKLDVSPIQNKWECFSTQLLTNPFSGCDKALVIIGSDKRGAIFGTYTLSQQIGVSP